MACSPLLHSLSRNNLGAAGAAALAPALAANGSLTALNLSSNQIGGYERRRYTDAFSLNHGYEDWIRTPEGPKAVADALLVNNSLTSLDLSSNNLCGVTDWGSGTYTTEGITAIADALRVNGALTSLDVRSNKIAGDGAAQLSAAVLGTRQQRVLVDLHYCSLQPDDELSLSVRSLEDNRLDAQAKQALQNAWRGAPSFAPAQQFLRGSYDEPGRGNGIASGSGLDVGEDESVDSDYDNDEDAFYDLRDEVLSGRLKFAKVYGQEEPPAAEDELEWETRYFVLYDTGKMCHFDDMRNGEPVGDRGLIDLDTIKTVEKVLGVPTFVMKGDKKVYLFKLEPHDEVKMRNWIGAITVELSASS